MTTIAIIPLMTNRLARRILLPFLFSVLIPSAFAQQKGGQASDDIVLSAMRAELDRSKSQLKMEQVAAPYYVEYRIYDVDQYSAEAAFGALRANVHLRYRFVRVVVRVGDYKQDTSDKARAPSTTCRSTMTCWRFVTSCGSPRTAPTSPQPSP